MALFNKKYHDLQIGLHKTATEFQFIWFNLLNQIKTLHIPLENIKDAQIQLNDALIQERKKIKQPLIISCIYPHLAWTKTVQLPQHLNESDCIRQCQFVLQKELPVPLSELWFDYAAAPLSQSFRLDIYAVRKHTVKNLQHDYLPFKINVLDTAANSILRAFYYLLQQQEKKNTLFLYQDEICCLALCERLQQCQMLQSQDNLTELYHQFIQRFPEPIEQVYVYSSLPITYLPHWHKVETTLPFLPLGNALWQQNLVRKSTAL
ncbi:competence protein ComA [Rodentibacter caecimuris]|uniref:Competence protein ComA n=1 Tax=Rodentibacter caecimuris TaxID=1796644 RepID=A0ABX3L045_9PAST|nr:hypothetical protein BKG89_01700 [Rodentibacter heylii]